MRGNQADDLVELGERLREPQQHEPHPLEQGRLEPKAHGLKRTEAGSHRFITCPLVGDGVVEGAYDVEVEALRGGDGERTSGVADNGERRARATECCGLVEDEPVDGVRLSAGHYPAQCSVSHA